MSSSSSEPTERILAFGEIWTGILGNSTELTPAETVEVLSLTQGDQVRHSQRPTTYGISSEQLTGVDCALPSRTRTRMRGVGTVATRATVTGGRVLQGSSWAKVARAAQSDRQPWSYYLASPGRIEALGKLNRADLIDGFMSEQDIAEPTVCTGLISRRVMGRVQKSGLLDGRQPFTAAPTALRWTFEPAPADQPAGVRYVIVNGQTRTLRLSTATTELEDILDLCEDLALHDWLLSTFRDLLNKALLAEGKSGAAELIDALHPAIAHLKHLWMPHARVRDDLLPLWQGLDRKVGFTQLWDISVNRAHDRQALSTWTTLSRIAERADPDEPSLKPATSRIAHSA